ncbi:MAG: esterase family protein [Bacteroidota bacterium]
MLEKYHKWYSRYLSRDFEMLVFGHSGLPVVLFPTAEGRYYDNKDNGLIGSVEHLLDSGMIKIYCPDSIDCDSWLNWNIHPADRVKTYMGYENLVHYDVLEFVRADSDHRKMILAGCSLGAYYASNISFKYPDYVSAIMCMGGTYDIRQYLDDYYDDNCYFNNPVDYLPGLEDEWYIERIRKMRIFLGTGKNDICLEENLHMSSLLNGRGIPHILDMDPQADHHWYWWKQMFNRFLNGMLA